MDVGKAEALYKDCLKMREKWQIEKILVGFSMTSTYTPTNHTAHRMSQTPWSQCTSKRLHLHFAIMTNVGVQLSSIGTVSSKVLSPTWSYPCHLSAGLVKSGWADLCNT